MSKTNKTTKIATFVAWYTDFGTEICCMGADFAAAHDGSGRVLARTSAGLVAWTHTFSGAVPGDKVVLRKGAARSHGAMPWVMTGLA